MLAVRAGDEKAARRLDKKGRPRHIPDSAGRTAAELAARQGMGPVTELLL